MKLRVLIILQIVCVAFIGAACREGPDAVFSGRLAGPAMRLAAIVFHPVWIGFPILVYKAVKRLELPAWKCLMLAGIEAALVFATWLALLPAVQ